MATILIVDDEQNTRDALDMVLRREEHEVIAVGSGESALDHLNTHEVDLVLSDVKMPGIDGLTLLRRVKAHDAGIVVVMMSGYGDITVAVEAMKEGAFDYLVKPCKKDDVLRTVAKALKMRAVLVENVVLKRQIQEGAFPSFRSGFQQSQV